VETSVLSYTAPIVLVQKFSSVPIIRCEAGSGNFSQTNDAGTLAYSYVNTCSREWTIGQAMSPIGLQWNFRPRKRLQRFVEGHGGYMYTTQPIPVVMAGSFNSTLTLARG
jgi:hypothetical protein